MREVLIVVTQFFVLINYQPTPPPKRALMIYRKEIRDRNKQKVARGGENKKQSKKSEIIISRDSAYRPVDSGATGTPRKG